MSLYFGSVQPIIVTLYHDIVWCIEIINYIICNIFMIPKIVDILIWMSTILWYVCTTTILNGLLVCVVVVENICTILMPIIYYLLIFYIIIWSIYILVMNMYVKVMPYLSIFSQALKKYITHIVKIFKIAICSVQKNIKNQKCIICYENKINIALIPCGHTFCNKCLDKINRKNCSICNAVTLKRLRIYL